MSNRFLLSSILLSLALATGIAALHPPMLITADAGTIKLLEPVGGKSEINVGDSSDPIAGLFEYFNALWGWVLGVAAGMTVAWVLWAGMGIINSGGDQSKFSASVGQMKGALIGLFLLIFIGVILKAINASFFKAS